MNSRSATTSWPSHSIAFGRKNARASGPAWPRSGSPASILYRARRKPSMADRIALGLDFGTESVRAVLVDLRGRERAATTARYEHGQIIETLPGSTKRLPPHYALQHPQGWLDSAAKAVRAALRASGVSAV